MNPISEKTRDSILASLDGRDPRLFPYLPELLQDLWEMGTDAEVVLDLIRRHVPDPGRPLRILDLGCGKGAVSLRLAGALDADVHGVDAMAAFVDAARAAADERGLAGRCRFSSADVRSLPPQAPSPDVVILGAIGPVFGDMRDTVARVGEMSGGARPFLIVDDAYLPDRFPLTDTVYLGETAFREQLAVAGVTVLAEVPADPVALTSENRRILAAIRRRAVELTARHPEHAGLF